MTQATREKSRQRSGAVGCCAHPIERYLPSSLTTQRPHQSVRLRVILIASIRYNKKSAERYCVHSHYGVMRLRRNQLAAVAFAMTVA